jgi:thiaminase/transcriptional activator TenA
MQPLFARDSLIARLIEGAGDDWRTYVGHPFVTALGDGSLATRSFRHYLVQDYLFLVHFARAYALAAYKTDDLDEMRGFARTLDALINRELDLHVAYCGEWGLDEAAVRRTPEAQATVAYTRFVLERGMAGDLLDLAVALAPCVIGYAVIAEDLAARERVTSPYQSWIDAYAGEDYRQVATNAALLLDRVAERRGGAARMPELVRTFALACRLESGFWQMGLDVTP